MKNKKAEKTNGKLKNAGFKTLSVIIALALWETAAVKVGMEILLASPLDVAKRLVSIWSDDGFFSTVFFSLLRIMSGFLLAFVIAIAAGFVSFRFRIAETLLWPYVVTVKSVPIASFIILCLIWLSYGQITVFISFLIAFPVIYSNVLNGLKATDPLIKEAADLYKVPWRRRLIYIYVPQIRSYLISACGVAIGMAWKAGVAAEVLGVISGSIGEKLYESKIYLLSADLFAWTITVIILSAAIEKIFVLLLKAFYKGVVRL